MQTRERARNFKAWIFRALLWAILPVISLLAFFWIATVTFSTDKVESTLESTSWISKTRASRVSAELNAALTVSQALILSYRPETRDLGETGALNFERDPKFLAFKIYSLKESAGDYEKVVELAKNSLRESVAGKTEEFQAVARRTRENAVVIEPSTLAAGTLLIAARFGEPTDPNHLVSVLALDATDLARVFMDSGFDRSFVLRKSGGDLFMPGSAVREAVFGPHEIWKELAKENRPEGSGEVVAQNGAAYLAAHADVGVGDLVVVSYSDEKKAFAPIETLARRARYLLIAVLALGFLFGSFVGREKAA